MGSLSLASGSTLFRDTAPLLLLLFGLVVIGVIVITAIRRRYRDEGDGPTEGFTLHDLRTLHAQGKLTDEEFEHAKAQVIGRVRGNDADGAPVDPDAAPGSGR